MVQYNFTIWIVAASESQQRFCTESLPRESLRFFQSWEAIIAELGDLRPESHPRFCFLYDFSCQQTKMWLPLLRDQLSNESEIVLFGPARDLTSLQHFFREGHILDYLGLPLNAARMRARFERNNLMSA